MAKVKKATPTQENLFYTTPEQKVLKLLLTEPTTLFNMRAISSKLKGVRGLGGVEGITQILDQLEELGFVVYLDNRRSVRLQNEHPLVRVLKLVSSASDLEGLCLALKPIAKKGILVGVRSQGDEATDSPYELIVISEQPEDVKNSVSGHPQGKLIQLSVYREEEFLLAEKKEKNLKDKIKLGFILWGPVW